MVIYMKTKCLIIVTTIFSLINVGCSDKKEEPQSQQQVEQPIAKKKTQIPLDSSRIVILKDSDSNDSISVRVKRIMETDDFKKLEKEKEKYNDSLKQENVKNVPKRPGPEGVLRNLMKLCKERGDCPNE